MTDLGPVLLPVAALAAVSVAYIFWHVDPAWPLCLGIAATVFSGYWSQVGLPFPLDRLLVGIGIVCVIVRSPGASDRPSFHFRRVHWWMAAAAGYAIVSAAAAQTLNDSAAVYALLDRFGLLPFLLFAIAPLAFHSPRQRRILIGVLVALGAYLGATALFQAIGPKGLIFPSYLNDPGVGIHAGRARGPFVQATDNGFALSACAVACLVAAATWQRRSSRMLAIMIALACSLGLVLALERSIWIGFSAAAIVTLVLFREVRRVLVPGLTVLVILVAFVFLASPSLLSSAQQRGTDYGSVWDRQNTDAAGLRMIAAQPLFGFGWHEFQARSGPYFRQQEAIPLTGTDLILHNIFLSNAVELGVIGALLWLIAIGFALGAPACSRSAPELNPWRIGLIMLIIEWLIVANFSPLTGAFTNVLLWTWAGVVLAPDAEAAALAPQLASQSRPSALVT